MFKIGEQAVGNWHKYCLLKFQVPITLDLNSFIKLIISKKKKKKLKRQEWRGRKGRVPKSRTVQCSTPTRVICSSGP